VQRAPGDEVGVANPRLRPRLTVEGGGLDVAIAGAIALGLDDESTAIVIVKVKVNRDGGFDKSLTCYAADEKKRNK
jgi:hypothetical protein